MMAIPNAYNYGQTSAMPPNASEYNPNGDQWNGGAGAQTPASMFNTYASPRSSTRSQSPFESMLTHAAALNGYTSGAKKIKAPGAGDGYSAPGTMPPSGPAVPPYTGSSMGPSGPSGPSFSASSDSTFNAASDDHTRPSSPTLGVVDVSGSGLDPQYQAVLQRWLQGHPEYGWLADPKYSWLVPQYFGDQSKTASTDVVDWLHSRMQAVPGLTADQINTMNPAYKRSGGDTYLGQYGTSTDTNNPNVQPWQIQTPSGGTGGYTLTTTPVFDQMAQAGQPQAGMSDALRKQIDDYIASKASGAAGGPPAPSTAATGDNLGLPQAPNLPDWNGGNAQPSAPTVGQQPALNASPQSSFMSQYADMLNPYFQQQQDALSKKMDAEAAVTGDINSGGYGVTKNIERSNLAAQQGASVANLAATGYENQQNRMIQKYGIDTTAAIERAGQQLQKYGIDVNQVMQRYGIDTQDKAQRFLAELDAQTKIKVAQMGDSAASRQAAATLAAAKIGAASADYRAGLDYNIGLGQLDLQNQGQVMNYILGQGGLNNNWINTLIGLINGVPPGGLVVKP